MPIRYITPGPPDRSMDHRADLSVQPFPLHDLLDAPWHQVPDRLARLDPPPDLGRRDVDPRDGQHTVRNGDPGRARVEPTPGEHDQRRQARDLLGLAPGMELDELVRAEEQEERARRVAL